MFDVAAHLQREAALPKSIFYLARKLCKLSCGVRVIVLFLAFKLIIIGWR